MMAAFNAEQKEKKFKRMKKGLIQTEQGRRAVNSHRK